MKRRKHLDLARFVARVREDGTMYYELCCSRCRAPMGDSPRSERLSMCDELCSECVRQICDGLERQIGDNES